MKTGAAAAAAATPPPTAVVVVAAAAAATNYNLRVYRSAAPLSSFSISQTFQRSYGSAHLLMQIFVRVPTHYCYYCIPLDTYPPVPFYLLPTYLLPNYYAPTR
jgi:hypothetical protein